MTDIAPRIIAAVVCDFERTAIGTLLPEVGLGNSVLGLDVEAPPERAWRLYAYLASFAFDYVVRQKIGGANLNQFLWRQLPVPPPDAPAWAASRAARWPASPAPMIRTS